MRLRLFFVLLLLSGSLAAQREPVVSNHEPDEPAGGWAFGLNLGMIMPSNYTANFYNGSENNENSLSRILDNKYYKEQIVKYIGYNYTGWDIPKAMPYKIAMSVGIHIRYGLDENHGFFTQVSYHKLQATDIFLLQLDVPQATNIDPTYIECPIVGEEERTHIDLGYYKEIPLGEKIKLNIELGINVNNTLVKSNKILVKNPSTTDAGLEYSIKYDGEHPLGEYDPGNVYDIRQGGIGFGGFGGGHLRFMFSRKISFDPGFNLYFSKIALDGYSDLKPQLSVFVRIIMTNFFTAE